MTQQKFSDWWERVGVRFADEVTLDEYARMRLVAREAFIFALGIVEDDEDIRAEKSAILQHKWHMSERSGYDVGFEAALLDWVLNYRAEWQRRRQIRSDEQKRADLAYAAAEMVGVLV